MDQAQRATQRELARHKKEGTIPPTELIRQAEEMGLLEPPPASIHEVAEVEGGEANLEDLTVAELDDIIDAESLDIPKRLTKNAKVMAIIEAREIG